jgi:hypothetical protein
MQMRYMLLVYTVESETLQPEELQTIANGHREVMQDAAERGVFRAAEPLSSTATATTVRVRNGKFLVSDGPFAETKEQLAGYYILECQDLDEAIQWASRIPTGCGGGIGSIEIRPIRIFARDPELPVAVNEYAG